MYCFIIHNDPIFLVYASPTSSHSLFTYFPHLAQCCVSPPWLTLWNSFRYVFIFLLERFQISNDAAIFRNYCTLFDSIHTTWPFYLHCLESSGLVLMKTSITLCNIYRAGYGCCRRKRQRKLPFLNSLVDGNSYITTWAAVVVLQI